MDEAPHPSILEYVFGIVAVFGYPLHNTKHPFPTAAAQLYVCRMATVLRGLNQELIAGGRQAGHLMVARSWRRVHGNLLRRRVVAVSSAVSVATPESFLMTPLQFQLQWVIHGRCIYIHKSFQPSHYNRCEEKYSYDPPFTSPWRSIL
jgi:hypothetical protein